MPDGTYADRAKSAARDFLRSAVVVDDDTYLGLPGPSEAAETDKDPTLADLPVIVIPEESPTEASPGRLDVAAVVRGFALMGIVCAAIRPEPPGADNAPDAAVLKASEGADLIILDWALYRDDGVQAERLIRALAGRPERGWLVIAVYTKSRRLDEIAAQVEETVRSACRSAVREGLVIKSNGLVVQILAKPIEDAVTGRDAVTAEELPERLVSIFAEAAGGLLSTAALRGLTALRNETLGILQSFDAVADPGFVAHRLLLPRPADAEDHAVALLAAELADVLESAGVGIEVDYNAVEAWVKNRGLTSDADIPPAKWGTVFSQPVPSGRYQAILDALNRGLKGLKANTTSVKLARTGFRSVAGLFCSTADEATMSNARFAQLTLMKSHRTPEAPTLGLGTVCECEGQVWVCIQPACDSVRLDGATGFPLVPLVPSNENGKFSLVFLDRNAVQYFDAPTKFREVQMRTFPVDAERGQVVATSESPDWFFTDDKPRRYRWIGELREQHAQRLAKRFGDRLSRPGFDDPEWVRRSTGGASSDEG